MKRLNSLIAIILFASCLSLDAQTPEFYELDFEMDSTKTAYKPVGKNYTVIRSKRGKSGVNKTAMADAILNSEVTEIVLVYTELNAGDLTEREEANQERWENLLKTYPELFQFSTSYKNHCQCNSSGDAELLKKTQGFYVYINGSLPKINEPQALEDAEIVQTLVPSTPPLTKDVKQPEKKEEAAKTIKKEEAVVTETNTKESNAKPTIVEPVKETIKEPEVVSTNEEDKQMEAEEDVVKVKVKKKPAVTKPRRAKDPKACRPPCYQGGDDDLNSFFKDKITLSKKQKRHGKNLMVMIRIQLNFDGSIKKTFVTGTDEILNQEVIGALNSMSNWNPAVKSGVAVKSEVKFTLKYDKESKSLKPADMMINPRPTPKCKCMSDEEIFGSAD